MFAGIGALVTWALTKALGKAAVAAFGGGLIIFLAHLLVSLIKKYYAGPFPKKNDDGAQRDRDRAEREQFLRTAVVNCINPSGKRLEEYPLPYRGLIEDLANMAGEIRAAIRIVAYSGNSITVDTGPYYADAIRTELTDRAARDSKRLTLRTKEIPTLEVMRRRSAGKD
jgi:hypothetical protein